MQCILRILFVGALACSSAAHRTILENNGYRDIVVAISPDVPKSNAQRTVENLMRIFRDASPVLYQATRSRAYFQNVTILLPESWTSIPAQTSTWESYNDADIRIAPANLAYGDTPYTVQAKGCGQAGEYIHFTPEYIANLNSSASFARYGPPGKVLVHEWAHLRYGVFDEYGVPKDGKYPLFYRPSQQTVVGSPNEIVPNICANKRTNFFVQSVNGGGCNINPQTELYDDDCRYVLSDAFKPKTSLMSEHSIASVTEFCDDGEGNIHNFEAPNKHNAMCSGESVWKIVTQHPDFAYNNPPRNISSIDPSFTVVRAPMAATRFVLVADVSGSMRNFSRITRLNQSAKRWIKYDIPTGSQLGIIQFSENATVQAGLTVVNDATRPQLMDKVPNSVESSTCIGCGLLKAIEILRPTGNGGVIILLTDGVHNNGPSINETLRNVTAAGVRVVTIAFGTAADKDIEDLAELTDGKSYFVSDDDTSQGLDQAFVGSLTYQPAVSAEDLVVKLFEGQYKNASVIKETFSVDFTIGKNLVLQVGYTNKTYLKSAKLIAPNGTEYSNLEYDDPASTAVIRVGMAMTGVWHFVLDISGNQNDSFIIIVKSQARENSTAPIYTTCKVGNGVNIPNANITPVVILAEVRQGSNAVLGAKVQAYIEKPDLRIEIIDLFDNGAVADVTKNDGIYSRYFIMATPAGRYSLKCQIRDEGSAFINNGFIGSSIIVHDDAPYCCGSEVPIADEPRIYTGNFSRSDAGGSFKIITPVSSSNPYPPGRVTDLEVVKAVKDGLKVTLQWTAPGEDLDFGTVSRYVIKYSANGKDLLESYFNNAENATDHLVGGSLGLLEAGRIQQVTFSLRNTTNTTVPYFFALKAVDKGGKESLVSNLATVFFADIQTNTPNGLDTGVLAGTIAGCVALVVVIAGIVGYFIRQIS